MIVFLESMQLYKELLSAGFRSAGGIARDCVLLCILIFSIRCCFSTCNEHEMVGAGTSADFLHCKCSLSASPLKVCDVFSFIVNLDSRSARDGSCLRPKDLWQYFTKGAKNSPRYPLRVNGVENGTSSAKKCNLAMMIIQKSIL